MQSRRQYSTALDQVRCDHALCERFVNMNLREDTVQIVEVANYPVQVDSERSIVAVQLRLT